MSTRAQAGASDTTATVSTATVSTATDPTAGPSTTASGDRLTGAATMLLHPWRMFGATSLAQRFLLANLAILLVAGLAVGIWVGNQLERSILDRTASVTALYVGSIIEPSVASLADGGDLTAEEIRTLDAHLASPAFADRVRSMRLWSEGGEVVYSPNPELIGQFFPVDEHLAQAWRGQVVSSMDDLSGEENAWERARWSRLLELYVPVRERGTERIIAVAEFYLSPRETNQQVDDARRTTWLVVTLAIVLSAALLFGIVKRGSDTIERQGRVLTDQVTELTTLLDQNAELSDRVLSAAERSTTLNERSMRRVSSDLHDGPGQMLSLALLRLDGLQKRTEQGSVPTAAELAEVEQILQEAMTDMRSVAAGLRVPELAPMSVEAVASRAVQDHERRSGASVTLSTQQLPADAPLPLKIALFRALQESLSNATRHGGGDVVMVTLTGRRAARGAGAPGLELVVRDEGGGFDPASLDRSEGLGLAGIREQAEILGGSFAIHSRVGAGTELRVWWPLQSGGLDAQVGGSDPHGGGHDPRGGDIIRRGDVSRGGDGSRAGDLDRSGSRAPLAGDAGGGGGPGS
jgi:signal transduction histidine kinase